MNSISKPDFTAWFVMQGLIASMQQSKLKSKDDEVALKFLLPLMLEARKTRLLSTIVSSLPYSWQYRIGNIVSDSNRLRHFYLRKKEIQKNVISLIVEQNIEQIVVLGAGLDVLSVKLAVEYPNIHFIEIDMRESQKFKTNAFATHRTPLPQNIEFIEGDLRNPLANVLRSSRNYSPHRKTIWIAEGFLMFIPEESITRIFKEILLISSQNSFVIFTTLPAIKQTTAFAYLIQTFFLHRENCPFKWVIPFDEVPSFMLKNGYKILNQINYTDLHKEYISGKKSFISVLKEHIHIAHMNK